ncbi:MAG: hypothetical protein R6U50_13245 [Desulfobacterales bacterium]
MKNLKFSLIDNDYAIQACTDLDISDSTMDLFMAFLKSMKEELITGQSVYFEIESADNDPVMFTVLQSN